MVLDTNCVRCGNRLNGHSEVLTDSPVVPKDGEISICIYCLPGLIMLLMAKLDLLEHVN